MFTGEWANVERDRRENFLLTPTIYNYVYIYVCMFVCMCVYIYVCTYVCMYIQGSPQNAKSRVVLVKRSKRFCGFATFFTSHQRKMLKSSCTALLWPGEKPDIYVYVCISSMYMYVHIHVCIMYISLYLTGICICLHVCVCVCVCVCV